GERGPVPARADGRRVGLVPARARRAPRARDPARDRLPRPPARRRLPRGPALLRLVRVPHHVDPRMRVAVAGIDLARALLRAPLPAPRARARPVRAHGVGRHARAEARSRERTEGRMGAIGALLRIEPPDRVRTRVPARARLDLLVARARGAVL